MNAEQWAELNERKQSEAENRNLFGEEAQLSLLHDYYAMVFRMYGHIRDKVKDMNLAIILMALRYRNNMSQADIAQDYGVPVGTIGNIVKKYSKDSPIPLIAIESDTCPGAKYRKILKLTELGEKKADEMLSFMNETLDNMKILDNKSPDVKYGYLAPLEKSLNTLCKYTTGDKDALKNLRKGKKPARKGQGND